MLTLIGLGLFDEKDLTIRGMEEAKKADKAYVELYTSYWHGSIENLEKIVGKKVVELKRGDLEENSEKILEEAERQSVVIFVQGDPLVQTTHTALVLDAKKRKIETKTVHNASVISAIAEIGLHSQKFGPYVTIPFLEKTKGSLPESVYEILKMNKARGLHTLCLLDVVADENRYMTPSEALQILLEIEKKRKEGVLTEDSEVILASKLGSNKPRVIFTAVKELIKRKIEEKPSILIIPGILHFTEREVLSLLYSEE